MFEKISGSEDLKSEYENWKKMMEAAESQQLHATKLRRGAEAERRQAKEQKVEAEKYRRVKARLEKTKIQYYLWQLFYLEKQITASTASAATTAGKVEKLRQKRAEAEAAVAKARQRRAQLALASRRAVKKQQQAAKAARWVVDIIELAR